MVFSTNLNWVPPSFLSRQPDSWYINGFSSASYLFSLQFSSSWHYSSLCGDSVCRGKSAPSCLQSFDTVLLEVPSSRILGADFPIHASNSACVYSAVKSNQTALDQRSGRSQALCLPRFPSLNDPLQPHWCRPLLTPRQMKPQIKSSAWKRSYWRS